MLCPYCGVELEEVGNYKLDCPNIDCMSTMALEMWQWEMIANRRKEN